MEKFSVAGGSEKHTPVGEKTYCRPDVVAKWSENLSELCSISAGSKIASNLSYTVALVENIRKKLRFSLHLVVCWQERAELIIIVCVGVKSKFSKKIFLSCRIRTQTTSQTRKEKWTCWRFLCDGKWRKEAEPHFQWMVKIWPRGVGAFVNLRKMRKLCAILPVINGRLFSWTCVIILAKVGLLEKRRTKEARKLSVFNLFATLLNSLTG